MIDKLVLTNFEAHKNSELVFDKGFNVITGTSDSGKSSLLRALRLVINNTPNGVGFINHDENNVTVKRHKTRKGKNQYLTSEDTYEGFGQKVPEEVDKIFNIKEINFQKQMDSPFLLSSSPGEISRYINEVVNLGIMDKTLKNLASAQRKEVANQKSIQYNIDNLKEKLNLLSDINSAEALIKKGESLQNTLQKMYNNQNNLISIIEKIETLNNSIEEQEKGGIKELPLINNALALLSSIERPLQKQKDLQKIIEEGSLLYKEIGEDEEGLFESKQIIETLLEKSYSIKELSLDKSNIENLYNSIEKTYSYIEEKESKGVELQKKYKKISPKICPLCGK